MFTTEQKSEAKQEMPDNHFYGKLTTNMEDSKQCMVMNVLKKHKESLEEDFNDARLRLGDATLDKENWVARCDCEMKCNVIKGQISLISKLQKEFENMMSVVSI